MGFEASASSTLGEEVEFIRLKRSRIPDRELCVGQLDAHGEELAAVERAQARADEVRLVEQGASSVTDSDSPLPAHWREESGGVHQAVTAQTLGFISVSKWNYRWRQQGVDGWPPTSTDRFRESEGAHG
jgi:hypothetical protein